MVARSWHKGWLEDILSTEPIDRPKLTPSHYLSLPLMSIVQIARYLLFPCTAHPSHNDECKHITSLSVSIVIVQYAYYFFGI